MKFKNSNLDHILLNFFDKYVILTDEEKEAIIDLAFFKSFKKGTILLKEGQLSKNGYFVVKGCIRCYYIIDGEEKTTAFYTETEILNPPSAVNFTPSEYYISCLEDSILIVDSAENDAEIFKKYPKLETICRLLSEESHAKNLNEFNHFKISSPEQRYLNFLETRPDLAQRVPQYHLASYLGITPQSLSRMRNRLIKRVS